MKITLKDGSVKDSKKFTVRCLTAVIVSTNTL